MRRYTLRAITALALATGVPMISWGAHARVQATSLAANALPLTNPLLLKNQVTGAQAQMMPSIQWLSQHGQAYAVGTGDSGSASSGPATTGSAKNLSYYGGPVVHSISNHIIFWLPKAGTTTYSDPATQQTTSCPIPATVTYSYELPASGLLPVGALRGGPDGDTDYENILTQYFEDLNGTSYYNLLTQYADEEGGPTLNNVTFGGSWTDGCGYTSTPSMTTGPVPGGTAAAPIYQIDIQAEVERAIRANNWPEGLGNEYYVYTGYGAADCFAPPDQSSLTPTCSIAGPNPSYCAYHSDYMDTTGNYVLYSDMADGGFSANPSGEVCYTSPIGSSDPSHTVNGRPIKDPIADAEVSITSHEGSESVTDAEVGTAPQLAPPLAWYDAVNGEIGDKCAYIYGHYATDGSNITLHGDHYIVQEEYSNWNNGCALTPYQGNGGYGGDTPVITIQKGWNVIGIPTSGITSTTRLIQDMTRSGQLPVGSIIAVKVYLSGKFLSSATLTRTMGILVDSKVAGRYTPSGLVYKSAPSITLNPGWNLVAATYPNPGLMTDVIYNEIAEEANACSAGILTNSPCQPTISEIKVTGTAGYDPTTDTNNPPIVDWKPAAPDSNGNATWPKTQGDQIPFTSGMWIYATKSLTWNVLGSECQTVDSYGVCH